MSTDDNKAIALRFLQAWVADDLAVIDELAAPNFTASYPFFYSTHNKGSLEDLEEFKQAILTFQSGMSDITLVSDDIIAEGDKVVIHWTASGTCAQNFVGLEQGLSVIGQSMALIGITIYQIVDGKVVSEIGLGDILATARQLGLVSAGWKQHRVDG